MEHDSRQSGHRMHHEGASLQPQDHHGHMIEDLRKRFFVSLILTFPVLFLSPTIRDSFGLKPLISTQFDLSALFFFSSIIFFYGGLPFLKGLKDELRRSQPGMMTLIGLAITVAYAYSASVVFGLPGMVFFWELATLIDIMLLGHWLEMRSISRASGALEELVRLMPSRASILRKDGSVEEIPVDDLKKGDHVLVKPGEKVPIDGRIIEGRTTVDESMVTGESRPAEKGVGDEVIGGVINGESAIVIDVEKTGKDTYLSLVIDMVRRAQESRSRAQVLSDRAAFWLTVISLSVGSTTLAVWLVLGQDFVFALARMVTVMVITCPHALGLAVPLVVAISTTLAARNGLLINDRSAFEKARDIDTVVFDKTGTLTLGRFTVVSVIPDKGWKPDSLLSLAASLESRSEHPIARAIVEKAHAEKLALASPEDFRIIPGKGAQAVIDGRQIVVVSPGYLKEKGIEASRPLLEAASHEGRTTIYVIEDGRAIGVIQLSDIVRPESREAIREIKSLGIEVMMLTGDSRFVADVVAEQLGLDDYFAEVLPDEKARKIEDLERKGLHVAMVGDGVNDAPALAAADLGIAIGAGTDVAIESGDIVLVRSDPRDVFGILKLSRATYRKMIQNLFWATVYNIIAIPLAAGVLYPWGFVLPPAAGAITMSASTIIVAINAQFLWRMKGSLRENPR